MNIETDKTGFDQKDRKRLTGSGYDITLFAIEGRYFATDSKCPHMGGPLFLSKTLKDDRIMCPSHHIIFKLATGEVVSNPIPESMGDYAICGNLKTYTVSEQKDLLIVTD
jgi:Ferredoxin subunits of nitrite reductase and ring-hydroxylating dioxygenases